MFSMYDENGVYLGSFNGYTNCMHGWFEDEITHEFVSGNIEDYLFAGFALTQKGR